MIRLIHRILTFSGAHAWRIRLAIVFAFFKSLFANMPIFVAMLVIRALMEGRLTVWHCEGIAGAMMAIVVLQAVCQNISDRLQSAAGYQIFAEKRMELGEHLRKLPMGYFSEGNMGKISSVLSNDMVFMEEHTMAILADCVSDIFAQLILTAFLFGLHPLLGIVALSVEAVAVAIAQPMRRVSLLESAKQQQANEDLTSAVLEYVDGIAVVKSFNLMGDSANKLRRSFEGMRRANLEFVSASVPYQRLLLCVYGLGSAGLLAGAIWLLQTQEIVASDFVGVMLFLFGVFAPLRHLYLQSETITLMTTGMERLSKLMDETELADTGASPLAPPTDAVPALEFRHVSFAYESDQVLEDVCFSLYERQMLALVGASGSGKSTIASLTARLWDVDEGSILIRGTDIRDVALHDLMEHVSMVFQQVYLFEDTIYNNIALGRPSATRAEVVAAAKKARCHDFIMALPYGYDTVIGEGGASISGGERQRISIARCILKDAPLIILDEATASVDADNEAYIQQAISELCQGKTVMVIAHRLHTIRNANKILVIDHGHVVESGTHAQLVDIDGGIYRHMCELDNSMLGWDGQALAR